MLRQYHHNHLHSVQTGRKWHTAVSIFIACICLGRTPTSAFKLSSLGSILQQTTDKETTAEDETMDSMPPRQSLIEKYGEEGYKRIVNEALGAVGGGNGESTSSTESTQLEYGVDISFPIHHEKVSTNYAWLPRNNAADDSNIETPSTFEGMTIQPLGDKQSFYEDFLDGCREYYGERGYGCDLNEKQRIEMNLLQPVSMQNYTELGFKKIRAPQKLFEMLTDFWERNNGKGKKEEWPVANTYTNHWKSPTYMIDVGNGKFAGGGVDLRDRLWDAARETIQQWTGEELTPCSLYGIRVYRDGSVLAPHVDRLPLVSSAIINVAQDVDEDWPLEVIGHDGKAYNITMEPGDMILYESHSIVHGRSFPLKGRYYANVFVHFEPVGYSLRHKEMMEKGYDSKDESEDDFNEAAEKEVDDYEGEELPSYILEGSPEAKRWRQEHPPKVAKITTVSAVGTSKAHTAAAEGNLVKLKELAADNIEQLFGVDANGWQPLHEAARGGHTYVVDYLIKKGADINARTNNGNGGSTLWWAWTTHGDDHPVVKLLKKHGAKNIAPNV